MKRINISYWFENDAPPEALDNPVWGYYLSRKTSGIIASDINLMTVYDGLWQRYGPISASRYRIVMGNPVMNDKRLAPHHAGGKNEG